MSNSADINELAGLLAATPRPREMTVAQRKKHKRARDRRNAFKRYWLRKAQEGVSVWISPNMLRFLRTSGLWNEEVSFEQALDGLRIYCIALESFATAYDEREKEREAPAGLLAMLG